MRGGTVLSTSANTSDFSEIIAENFGANANYVEGLLNRFRSDPSLVDESWRTYFSELLGDRADGNGHSVSDGSQAADSGGTATQAPQQQQEAATPTAGAPAVAAGNIGAARISPGP